MDCKTFPSSDGEHPQWDNVRRGLLALSEVVGVIALFTLITGSALFGMLMFWFWVGS